MQLLSEQILCELTPNRLLNYWEGFASTAFAIYDDKDVFLFNHPKCKQQQYIKINKDEQFNACTLILFEEYPTAIVDVTSYETLDQIYSLLVHELFHGYQYLYGENRFPDELIGLTYLVDPKNVRLRILERQTLYDAVITDDPNKLQLYINQFISLRERRAELFEEFVEYENLTETIEGPAHYVELQALQDIRQNQVGILDSFSTLLLDRANSQINIRRSCYGSGLFICLLLDKVSKDWQLSFTESSLSLYHFFQKHFSNHQLVPVKLPDNQQEVNTIVDKARELKMSVFEQFNQRQDSKIIITGLIKIIGFDPMNITVIDGKALHHHFVKLKIGNNDYLIQKPVHTTFSDDFMQIETLQFYADAPPEQVGDQLFIDGMGWIKGRINSINDKEWQLFI
ncbi:hypothetical protein ACS127_03170 [Amphibacillus sp. Q70]|uniref:hypothetical protein n=1 Tax=Amphibacillus sp. Q70 TaxID=3453416 RepID=UPI003F86BC10